MKVAFDAAALRSTNWKQYALRFVLGGLVTVAAGLIATGRGPVIGGLFLAFPAIFPASATLIAQREREKKKREGLDGTQRGARAAALDAAGTILGALALIAFAFALWRLLPRFQPEAVIGAALVVWIVLSLALWSLRKNLKATNANSVR